MKNILLFGAGKSATVLIQYLVRQAAIENWFITVVDADLQLAMGKLSGALCAQALSFDITHEAERKSRIEGADIVISLLPPALHILVAHDCVQYKKNLLTASYVDAAMKELEPHIVNNNLLFLCEMGLDPGIDHMSARQMIDGIENEGGKITSFLSHCGGLVAPESDDNPWHYKISWNPRNVVMAGKSGALFKQHGQFKKLDYEALFAEKRPVEIKGLESLCWYPNRDSLAYMDAYNLRHCHTFIRTTLRHPDFMYGWKNIIDLKLTDEKARYDTDGKTLKEIFKEHLDKNNFNDWLDKRLTSQFAGTQNIITELVNLAQIELKAADEGTNAKDDFLMVDKGGDLRQADMDDVKLTAAEALASRLHDAKITLRQLFYLGMDDDQTLVNKGICDMASVLQFALEQKLALKEDDRDMVVMQHEVTYDNENKSYRQWSTLVVKGNDSQYTAMAKTVGLPLGIAAKLILNGTITTKGLHIPISREMYKPVLHELEKEGILFQEKKEQL